MYGGQQPNNFNFDDDPNTPPSRGDQPPYQQPSYPPSQPPVWGTGQPTDPFGNPVTPYNYVPVAPPPQKNRSINCLIVLIIGLTVCLPLAITAVIILAVGGGIFSAMGGIEGLGEFGNVLSTAVSAAGGPEMQRIQGDPSNFDPLVSLEQAQSFAGEGAVLAALSAHFVRSDGTMDLNADYTPSPHTEYEFLRPIDPPANAPPVGAAGNTGGQWYEPITITAFEPGQMRRFTQIGGGMNISSQYINEGMTRVVGSPTTNPVESPVPPPRCAFTDLWEEAIRRGAPQNGVAVIEYDEDGYTFDITGQMLLRFDMNCRVQ